MGSSTPSTTTQNTHTTAEPWGPAQNSFLQMISNAQQAYDDTPKVPSYSGPNSDQIAAVDYTRSLAGRANTGAAELRNLGQATARGDYLHAESNPYLQGAYKAAIDPLRDQFDDNLFATKDVAQRSGAYGGSRDQLMRTTAATEFNKDAINTGAQMFNANYQSERDRQQNAGNLLNQANVIDSQPGLLLDQVGSQVQGWDDRAWAAEQDAPWLGMDKLAGMLGTVSPYGSSSGAASGTGMGAQPSKGASALTGAASGAMIGYQAGGGWGALIGAGLGAIGGYATGA